MGDIGASTGTQEWSKLPPICHAVVNTAREKCNKFLSHKEILVRRRRRDANFVPVSDRFGRLVGRSRTERPATRIACARRGGLWLVRLILLDVIITITTITRVIVIIPVQSAGGRGLALLQLETILSRTVNATAL